MTIEIKELHIRVSVTAPTSTAPPAGSSGAPAPHGAGGTESIVAACVEQVMDLLRDRSER